MVAGVLGFALLLKVGWQQAVEWALNQALPAGWCTHDLTRAVATCWPLMSAQTRDETLTKESNDVPSLMREHGERLEEVARTANP